MITWTYSPRKNMPNFIPEYSVWKPPMSSCSDSGRSNGKRLVSANALIEEDQEADRRHENSPDVLVLPVDDRIEVEGAGTQD